MACPEKEVFIFLQFCFRDEISRAPIFLGRCEIIKQTIFYVVQQEQQQQHKTQKHAVSRAIA